MAYSTLYLLEGNQTMTSILPAVDFKMRVPNSDNTGFRWEDVSSYDLFAGLRVVIFSLPGAFTPTCSTMQVPSFEERFEEFLELDIDAVYCISVNDAFVMNAWSNHLGLKNVQVVPDGSGYFTSAMGMLVDKDNLGFGLRSWRYAVIADNGRIEKMFVEPGMEDNCLTDPYGETSPERILEWIKAHQIALVA